jgi:pimeloyl-ACP methyl ester carboxylesterase
MGDITAVLDAVGGSRSHLFGLSTSANVRALFAATYPERCDRLVLDRPYPRGVRSDEHPGRWTEEEWLTFIREVRERGEHDLKGVPGKWRLYAVVDG